MAREQHTVTIDNKKYDYDTAMRDPALKQRYTYLSDDPKGIKAKAMEKALREGASKGTSVADQQALQGQISSLKDIQAGYSPEAKSPVLNSSVPTYDRDTYLNSNNFKEASNAGTAAERSALDAQRKPPIEGQMAAIPQGNYSQSNPQTALSDFQSGKITANQYNQWASNYGRGVQTPGAGQPQTLAQGQSFMGGTVGFDSATGKPLAPGQTTTSSPTSTNPTAPATGTSGGAGAPASLTDYTNQVSALQDLSKDEISAQKELDQLNANATQGQFNVSQQPIAQSFISGQKAAMQEQANIAQMPLQQKLALAQQRRMASLDAAKTRLDQANADRDYKLKEKSLEGEGFSLSEGEKRYDAKGNLIASGGPKTYAPTNDGLTPAQINTTVNSIAGAFDNEPIVKAYNTVQEGYQTIKSIGVNTSSPADDIGFIYAFAKIMDPNSVVREGEYNTIQKYAQTWADNFGFKAQRIFSNTNFLTADAKQKMLNTLGPKVQTITNQYENLNKEYQRQVNDAYQGKPRQITDYAGGVGQTTTGGTGGTWDW